MAIALMDRIEKRIQDALDERRFKTMEQLLHVCGEALPVGWEAIDVEPVVKHANLFRLHLRLNWKPNRMDIYIDIEAF